MKKTNEVEGQRFVRFMAAYIKTLMNNFAQFKRLFGSFPLPTVRVCNMGDKRFRILFTVGNVD